MKKILFIPILLLALQCFGQSIPVAQKYLSTITDLRLEQPQTNEIVNLMGNVTSTDGNGGAYYWNSTSTATDDGYTSLQVSGITTGRWLRIPNNNALRINYTITPVALQTAYALTYGQTLPVTPIGVQVQSTSLNGAIFNYVTNITTTGFTLNFLSVPVGTCTFYVLVSKQ